MKLRFGLPALAVLLTAGSMVAGPIVLNFEGIASPSNSEVAIGNFYNGGGGPNFGISFSDNALALCLNILNVQSCSNTSRGGQGDPTSQGGGLFFLTGSQTFMNDPAGFDTGFSLFYSAVNDPGSLSVYDGLNGTGNVLATLSLPLTPSTCQGVGSFCPFVPVGVAFSGVAKSIGFAGVGNQIVFDDVTFGSIIPGSTVPEPATVSLMCLGLGLVALIIRRRNQSQA